VLEALEGKSFDEVSESAEIETEMGEGEIDMAAALSIDTDFSGKEQEEN
jgi:hypothetical protein